MVFSKINLFKIQETKVLRRKVEDLEKENETNKRQIQELLEKQGKKDSLLASKSKFLNNKIEANDPLKEKKMKVMEDEINELRKKVIEKDRDVERLQAEMSLKGKSKIGLKSK